MTSRVFDCHQHFGSMTGLSVVSGVGMTASDDDSSEAHDVEVERRIAEMDREDIGRAVMMPSNSYLRPHGIEDTMRVNDSVLRYCATAPERMPVGVGVTEPIYGSPGLAEVERIAQLGLVGISYHTRFQGVAITNPWLVRHVEVMTELHLIPFIHIYSDSSMESPLMLKRLAEQFPSTPFIALDGFMTAKAELECMMLAEACPNVVFDTALVRGNSVTQLVAALGAERFLLGTDFYSGAERLASANTPWRIKSLIADEEDQQAILYGNLERVLRWANVPVGDATEAASKEA